jgi:hypothetical protein
MMTIRWQFFAILGALLLFLGIALVVFAQDIPVYYAGGGAGISITGKVVGGLAPDHCEIPVITVPNTIHIHASSVEPVTVIIEAPNGTVLAKWQNESVNVDFTIAQCGIWKVNISQPSDYFVYGYVLVTAPVYAHPALMYASIPIVLGTMSLMHSIYKRKQASYLEDIQFKQNIGGRWVFLSWIPILVIISQAPYYIPSFPWLYALLIIVTVAAVFFSFALAYVKIYLSSKSFYIEAPFLSFHKRYEVHQISGYTITQENKQRLFGFWEIPSRHPEKEDQITIYVQDPLPVRIWITSLATRLYPDKIVFRPKSTEKFTNVARKMGITKKEAADL